MRCMFICTMAVAVLFLSPLYALEKPTPAGDKSPSTITVAAAADLQYALSEAARVFQDASGITVKTVFGSTGKLTTQIMAGAPFDIFLAANMAYPETLYIKGLAVTKPTIYLYGILVLWTVRGVDLNNGLRSLLDTAVKKIALPDPRHAPYGQAAVAALKQAGLYDSVSPKFVFGDNISQAAQFISSGSVEIGFNSKAIVVSPQMAGKGQWIELPTESYPKIAQGAVILKYGQDHNPEAAKQFYDFILGEKARAICLKYGFVLPAK
ncbi:MAG: molybdate ABC transporter substrate-binding protein [Fibrobacterota bacterium]